jgi:hypothetical protein
MKQPRTSDFDPTAMEHDLKSSMEDFPGIEQPKQLPAADRLLESAPPGLPGLPGRPGREEPPTTPKRRKIKPRHGFDVYEDQVEELRQLALEDRMRGGTGSMSAMLREAIDDYLAKVRS